MIMTGARTSLAVALVAVGVGMGAGVPLGLAAAARAGSWLDDAIMRSGDLVFAFPSLVIAIMITAVFGPSALNAILAIGLFNVPVFARVARGGALPLFGRDFALAARVAGKRSARIAVEHVLPLLASVLIVQGTIQFSLGILAEAGLSYVGLGAQPPVPSWGRMLADAQTLVAIAPHTAIAPGLAIVLTVLGAQPPGRRPARPARPPAPVMLSVEDLRLSIDGTEVLRGVSLGVEEGDVTALTGESGSGKSMTALSIMRLLPEAARASGRIVLDGTDLMAAAEPQMCRIRGARVGMVFQEPMTALNPLQTIGAQVAETIRLHTGAPPAEASARAAEALTRAELPPDRVPPSRYPHELSGGQRQRVVVAIATALRPRLLIADEPTTALDVLTQARILDLLRGLAGEHGMGLLLVTHDLAVVAGIAHRLVVMRDGEVVEDGPTARVLARPRHPYTRALMDASSTPARRGPPADRLSPGRRAGDTRRPAAGEPSGGPGPDRGSRRAVLHLRGVVREHRPPGGLLRRRPAERILHGIDLTVHEGESVGLVGPSGCGKSTLARAVLGLDPIQAGSIRLGGEPMGPGAGHALRRRIQAVFQDPYGSLNPRHRAGRLVAEPFHLARPRPDAAARRAAVAEALDAVGLPARAIDRHPHEFSGGQRQRLAIARALVIRPDIVVLDEAVSALDVRVRARVLDLLADLQDRLGLAYLFISHDLAVVRAVTDRVIVMEDGRIVEEGPTEAVFAAPRHAMTRALLAAVPRLPADADPRSTEPAS